jgi:hypothetical protein
MTTCSPIGDASGSALRILSRETFGAGGMMVEFKAGEVRVLA